MKIRIKKLRKQILAAAMAGVLLISASGAESVLAAQEAANEEFTVDTPEMQKEVLEEVPAGENPAGSYESPRNGVDVNAGYRKSPSNPVYDPATDSTVWDYVYFGGYPQTSVEASDEIAEASYSSANYMQGDYAIVNGTKYFRVYSNGEYRYYKYEPIKWRVLKNDGSTLFVMADQVLDGRLYWSGYRPSYPITWQNCDLREWLNDTFYENAFNGEEQKAIVEQTVTNEDNPSFGTSGGYSTGDKIYILSCSEAMNSEYGFSPSDDRSPTRQIEKSAYS